MDNGLASVVRRLDKLDRARPCRGVLSSENMAFWAELDKNWTEIRAALSPSAEADPHCPQDSQSAESDHG